MMLLFLNACEVTPTHVLTKPCILESAHAKMKRPTIKLPAKKRKEIVAEIQKEDLDEDRTV